MIDDLESQCTAICISDDFEMLGYGDELGFLFIYSLETMSPVISIKSMGYRILDVSLDESHSMVVAYDQNVSIFDKYGNSIRVYNLKEDYGDVVKLQRKQNMLVACTSIGHFFLFDLMSDEILGDYRCKNSNLVDSITRFSGDKDFFKGVAGNEEGDVITFEIL